MADFRQQTGDEVVKPPSTAAVATDPALVVSLSPNSPLPAGTNALGTVNVTPSTAPGTYAASVNGLVLAALATDIFTITGSASKTIRVTQVRFNAIQTTAAQVGVVLLRRSTADTAGTSTVQAAVPYDTANAAATATVTAYTANPTTGTLVGNLFVQRVFVPGMATATDAQGLSETFGDFGQQPFVLRGVAQQLAINLAGVTVTGGAASITVEWTES